MDQSNRYADLSLHEADLIKGGRHILVAYKMKPKAGHGYLEAAAHFAAESSTGTNVEVSTTDEFTKGLTIAALSVRVGERFEIAINGIAQDGCNHAQAFVQGTVTGLDMKLAVLVLPQTQMACRPAA